MTCCLYAPMLLSLLWDAVGRLLAWLLSVMYLRPEFRDSVYKQRPTPSILFTTPLTHRRCHQAFDGCLRPQRHARATGGPAARWALRRPA